MNNGYESAIVSAAVEAAMPMTRPMTRPMTLRTLALQQPARVCAVDTHAAGLPPERARQLADIGFVPGERVTVLTRAWPGGDPLVVLVGQSRFALRGVEAACVHVQEIGAVVDLKANDLAREKNLAAVVEQPCERPSKQRRQSIG